MLSTVASFNTFVFPFQVYIKVLDENDNVPMSVDAVYYGSVPEGSPAGRSVVQVFGTDNDKTDTVIKYKMNAGDPEGFFTINETTGKLKNCVTSLGSVSKCFSINSTTK